MTTCSACDTAHVDAGQGAVSCLLRGMVRDGEEAGCPYFKQAGGG